MDRTRYFREPVTVLMHLDGRVTKVGTRWGGNLDIPTDKIPFALRGLGSRFIMAGEFFDADPNDSPEEIRRKLHEQVIVFYEMDDT
jgi:hypothetical protein